MAFAATINFVAGTSQNGNLNGELFTIRGRQSLLERASPEAERTVGWEGTIPNKIPKYTTLNIQLINFKIPIYTVYQINQESRTF